MKGAQVPQPGAGFEIIEREIPEPGAPTDAISFAGLSPKAIQGEKVRSNASFLVQYSGESAAAEFLLHEIKMCQ